MGQEIQAKIKKLRKNSRFAYVGSVNGEGFPQVKCMFVLRDKDVRTHYFSTNTSTKRVAQFRANPKASVYYCSKIPFKGALFTGTMEVIEDQEVKARFWQKGDEKYYSKGVTDPDYCILKFTAEAVNYYQWPTNTTLPIESF